MTNYPGLPKNWVYSPTIDLELKQYTLLGYLQQVRARFAENKLYPYLTQVREHVEELRILRRSKEDLQRNLGGELLGFDPRSGHPIRKRYEDGEMLAIIDDVIEFAVPGLERIWNQGVELGQELVENIHFSPVGLQPLRSSEGWFFLRNGPVARVYRYCIPTVLEQKEDQLHPNILSRYVTSYTVGITYTYEHIKAELIARHPALPNPATYVLETNLDLPWIETYVPLAKRLVLAHAMKLAH